MRLSAFYRGSSKFPQTEPTAALLRGDSLLSDQTATYGGNHKTRGPLEPVSPA